MRVASNVLWRRREFRRALALIVVAVAAAACRQAPPGDSGLHNALEDGSGETAHRTSSAPSVSPAARPPAADPNGMGGRSEALARAGERDGSGPPRPSAPRFVGRWASNAANCRSNAWRFTGDSLHTPAESVCTFSNVKSVAGGYDISATCTAEGPPTADTLEIRFAESAKAMLFESDLIADAGLVRCPDVR